VTDTVAGPRVLVIDDSLTVRMDLEEALRAAGYATLLCSDLRAARAALGHDDFALVVLDVHLPDGDGLDFLRELRATPRAAAVPVMLLSTEAEVASRVRGMSAGADEYVGKPYDLGQLLARARSLIKTTPAAPRQAARTILIIDDSATYRHVLRRSFEDEGFAVIEAASGEEGLARAADAQPDAIIVDGQLPGIDGATVVRRVKSDLSLRGVPCVLLTAAEGSADELHALEAGADGYVRKSDDLDMVLVRLAALLRGTAPTHEDSGPRLLAPKRLLAVADSPAYLQTLAGELGKEGYDVVLASSGEEAIELLRAQPVDCILLDCALPGLSGRETCARIKGTPSSRDVPLVMLAARDDRDATIDGINAGADDVIAKNADLEVLKARLRAQLRRKQFDDENRRIREQLVRRETEARFARLIQSNIIGIFLAEPGGRLHDANDAFLGLVGWSRAELQAGELSWDRVVMPGLRARDEVAFEQLRNQGSAAPYETVLLRRPAGVVPVMLGMVLPEGSPTAVGFVLDRSEQQHAKEQLRQYAVELEGANQELKRAKDLAERESRFKSKFLAGMSHELRTPLNAIIGFSEMLQAKIAGPLQDKQEQYVTHVLTSGRHLLTLINDVLDLSKVEAGRMELAREWTPLAVVVDSVRGVVKPLADKRGITLAVALPNDLPDLFLDPTRTKQVLYNLLSNAIKFTPRGGLVGLGAEVDGGQVKVTCRDTGVGIRSEDMPRLFREFEQIEPASGEKPEGTGLGLALSRRLIELHGGVMWAESQLGKGSTFTFTLPVLRPAGPAAEAASDAGPLALLVEDDAQSAELSAAILQSAGLSVRIAEASQEALNLAVELKPAVILLDLVLPGTEDGWSLLRRLKGNPVTSSIPVVVASVVNAPARAVGLGATDYLLKPLSAEAANHALETCGIVTSRLTGLRVLVLGPAGPDLVRVDLCLHQAGCQVGRADGLNDVVRGQLGSFDVIVTTLGGDGEGPGGGLEALCAAVHPLGPHRPVVIALTSADVVVGPGPDQVFRLARQDTVRPERVVRAIRAAVNARRADLSTEHAETGLPAPLALRAHLQSALARASREFKRVCVVFARIELPRVQLVEPWSRRLGPYLRQGEYLAVAGEDLLALVVFGEGNAAEPLPGRFSGLLESVLGRRATGCLLVTAPIDGNSADSLIEMAIRKLAAAPGTPT
jgi:PAS domain S-box-containing protein